MRIKKLFFALLLIISLFNLSGCNKFSCIRYGSGTKDDPYLIYNTEQMSDLGGRVLQGESFDNKHFKLMNDLDFKGKEYRPIGTSPKFEFNGIFYGNNKTLKNISIKSNETYIGVFGYIGNDSSIYDLNVENINITDNYESDSYTYAGGLVGFANNTHGYIENCHVSGTIEVAVDEYISTGTMQNLKDYVGGLMGASYTWRTRNSSANVNVSGEVSGGLIGLSGSIMIIDCTSYDSEIIGTDIAGGLIGMHNFVYKSYAYSYLRSNVVKNNVLNSNANAGGLIGNASGVTYVTNTTIDATININQRDDINAWASGVVSYLTFITDTNSYDGESMWLSHVLTNVDINFHNESTSNGDIFATYFVGRVTEGYQYAEPKVDNSLFNGYIKLDKPIGSLKNEVSSFYNTASNVTSRHNALVNPSITKNGLSANEVAKYLRVDKKWISKSNSKFVLNIPNDVFNELNGEGTQDNPYLITTIEEFSYMFLSNDKKRYFKLENHIDASGKTPLDYVTYPNMALNNEPMFELDGNNKIISNFTTNSDDIFDRNIKDSLIKNLSFDNLTIESNYHVMFYFPLNTTLDNVDFDININGTLNLSTTSSNFSIKNSDITLTMKEGQFRPYPLNTDSMINNNFYIYHTPISDSEMLTVQLYRVSTEGIIENNNLYVISDNLDKLKVSKGSSSQTIDYNQFKPYVNGSIYDIN